MKVAKNIPIVSLQEAADFLVSTEIWLDWLNSTNYFNSFSYTYT